MDDQPGVKMADGHDVVDPWAAHVTRFRIQAAQLTATPVIASEDLTMVQGVTLVVEEGRYEHLREDAAGKPAPSVLEYGCYIREEGVPLPDSWAGTDAHVVITGTHENGWAVTVAGLGAIGRDESGRLEISFDQPPRIAVISPDGLA